MGDRSLHGVNLTGWLTLESWVTPELFAEAGALDEKSLIAAIGPKRYADVVRSHRENFITREDFVRIASRGFNAVRLAVPWYVFGDDGPDPGPFVGCIDEVDSAIDWAEEIGLKVILVLAMNLGAENPGEGVAPDNSDLHITRNQTLDIIYALARRYASRVGFYGIELGDDVVPQERHGFKTTTGVPEYRLRNYYREAYDKVRSAAGDDPIVILPSAGVLVGGVRFMSQSHYKNVWVDCHLDKPASVVDVSGPSGVRRLVESQAKELREQNKSKLPVMVGKWSSSLPIADSAMTPEGRIALERVYTSEQLDLYSSCPAWFFNTWKTSGLLTGWDARVAMATFERGMIV